MRFLKLFPMLAMSILLLTSCGGKNYAQELENQIKSMGGASAELGSVEYTISKIIAVDHDVFYKIGERKILFSSLSTMKAGVDLSLFCAKGESITQIDADKTLASDQSQETKRLEALRRSLTQFLAFTLRFVILMQKEAAITHQVARMI